MKLGTLILPILLMGCASHIPVPEPIIDTQVIDVPTQATPPTTIADDQVVDVPAPAPDVAHHSPTSTVVDKVKKVVKIVKIVKQELSKSDKPPAADALPAPLPAPPAAPTHISATGAKVQVFGIDLEFWVGNNDSWSTVWKLIVLMLFVYGGLRSINLLFDRFKLKTS